VSNEKCLKNNAKTDAGLVSFLNSCRVAEILKNAHLTVADSPVLSGDKCDGLDVVGLEDKVISYICKSLHWLTDRPHRTRLRPHPATTTRIRNVSLAPSSSSSSSSTSSLIGFDLLDLGTLQQTISSGWRDFTLSSRPQTGAPSTRRRRNGLEPAVQDSWGEGLGGHGEVRRGKVPQAQDCTDPAMNSSVKVIHGTGYV